MIKICIIGVFFGRLPSYFDLWLKSAEYNKTIDFKIFTDDSIGSTPQNVEIIPMTIQVMQKLASRKLGFEVELNRPYKCCDFKPAYGLIFEDYIQDFDYWGHCDFDLIWGDIRSFTDKFHIEEYERFLPLGHLSLYKKTDKHIFMLPGSACGDYKEVFTNSKHFAFDENNGLTEICKNNHVTFFETRIFADVSEIYKRFRLALNDVNYDNQIFIWENGKVKRIYDDNNVLKEEEYLYIHFKKRNEMNKNGDCVSAQAFLITPTGFYPSNGNISLRDIEKYNPFHGKDFEEDELTQFNKRFRKTNRIKNKLLKSFKQLWM